MKNVMKQHDDSGFTLVEVLMAVLILMVGLIAVANLFVVASTSTVAGSHGTAAASVASEVMERLKALPFNSYETIGGTTVGSLTSDVGIPGPGTPPQGCDDDAQDCVIAPNIAGMTNFNASKVIPGVGTIKTRWTISGGADPELYFIRVRSESTGFLVGAQSRAEYTTFRSCTNRTDNGCP